MHCVRHQVAAVYLLLLRLMQIGSRSNSCQVCQCGEDLAYKGRRSKEVPSTQCLGGHQVF